MINATLRHPVTRLCLAGALLCGMSARAQEIPPLVGTPDEIVFDFGQPQLVVPTGPRQNLTSPRTATLLAEALGHESQIDRRVELLTQLGQTQLDEGIETIRSALRDDAPAIRAAAARAAGAAGKAALAADLLPLVNDASATVRAEVVRAHAVLTDRRADASPAVLAGVKDTDPGVRIAAFAVAGNEPEARAIADQVPVLQGRLQIAAVEALGRIGSGAGVEALLPLLRGDVAQQSAAARALGRMSAATHAAAVRELLGHAHPTVRREALAALQQLLEADDARATAIGMLEDPDPTVRAAAASMAVPVPDAAVVAVLVKHLADPYLPLHDAALAALGNPAGAAIRDEVIRHAVTLLDSPQARRREDGTRLLGVFRSNAGIEKQLAILPQKQRSEAVDDGVMQQTAVALGLIGDQRAVPAVRSLAQRGVDTIISNSNDPLAGVAVVEALVAAGRLGDREIIPAARRIMGSNPELTPSEPRGAGAWVVGAVGNAGDESVAGVLMKLAGSQFDTDETKIEAVKAAGRLKLKSTAGRLQAVAEQSMTPELRWMALWAHARITGTEATYEPPVIPWRARVAVEDLPPR